MGLTLEDTWTPKYQLVQTFLPMKGKGKRIPKVASSSMSSMTLIEKLLTWKLNKTRIP